ncbi:MAG TPA: OmpA family protein [Rhizomicrobium sp.]|nr:OmpA family protein [Rhizomicrobium sp.]
MFPRLMKSSIVLFALALSACGGGPRPIYEPPPPAPTPHARALPQPSASQSHATRPAPVVVAAPQGPLVTAKVESYMDQLESDLRHHVRGAGIVVARQGNNINIVIPNTELFSEDGGVSGDDVLEPMGAILRNYGHTSIQVNGFTDQTGTPDQNIAVSTKRARLIADALVHEGVPAQRITSQGLGQTHLRIATGARRNEARNRRIEILVKARPG